MFSLRIGAPQWITLTWTQPNLITTREEYQRQNSKFLYKYVVGFPPSFRHLPSPVSKYAPLHPVIKCRPVSYELLRVCIYWAAEWMYFRQFSRSSWQTAIQFWTDQERSYCHHRSSYYNTTKLILGILRFSRWRMFILWSSWLWLCVCVCTHTHNAYIHTNTYIYICARVCMYIYIYTCIHTHVMTLTMPVTWLSS